MGPVRHRRVRLYQLLRTAHLERAHASTPASILYTDRRYDFDDELAVGLDLVPAGTLQAAVILLRSRVESCEVHEPLVRVRLVRTLLGVAVVRLSGAIARRKTRVVTYAIENRDPFEASPQDSPRSRARRWIDRRMTDLLARQIDSIAFGTQAAQDLYAELLGHQLAHSRHVLIPALPAPCTCPADTEALKTGMIFVGALETRKGVPQLLAAWSIVAQIRPDLRLTIVGKGRLEEQVRDFAGRHPSVDIVIDPPRADIHSRLREARGLVLLSQPQPRWREQVGLPVVEGLAHGCVVVTTAETGLASWLSQHGHEVLDAAADPRVVAERIIHAHDHGPDQREILGDLPTVDGRLAADAWMFSSS